MVTNARRSRFAIVLPWIALVAILALSFANFASATGGKPSTPQPTPPPPVVVEPDCTTQDCVTTPATPVARVIQPAQSSYFDQVLNLTSTDSSNVEARVVGNWTHIGTFTSVSKSKVNTKDCRWTKPGEEWTNTNKVGGRFVTFIETTPAYLCKLKTPIRRGGKVWDEVKMKGGASGSECVNLANSTPVKNPDLPLGSRVLDFRTLSSAHLKLAVSGSSDVRLDGSMICPAGELSGSASATASARAVIGSRIKVRSVMLVRGRIDRVAVRNYVKMQVTAVAQASASSSANLDLRCSGMTTTPEVVIHEYVCPDGSTLVDVDGQMMCQTCPPPVCVCPKGSSVHGKDCVVNPPTPEVKCPKGSELKSGKCVPIHDHPVVDCPPKGKKDVKSWTKSGDNNSDCPPKGKKGGKSTSNVRV